MIQQAYVVLDTSTKIILHFAPSRLTANILTWGMLNTKVAEFPIMMEFGTNTLDTSNDNDQTLRLISFGNRVTIEDASATHGNQQLIEKKELLKLRSRYLYRLELLCINQFTRTSCFLDHSLWPIIVEQLAQSDPGTDTYSLSLQEYATISKVSNLTAYQELMLKTQTDSLFKLRVQSLYDRHSLIMTTLTEEKEFERALYQFIKELYLDAYV